MNQLLVVGKRSNLSRALARGIPNTTLISSNEIAVLNDILASGRKFDIVYNSFVKSSSLRTLNDPEVYVRETLTHLAQFIALCNRHADKISTIIYTSSSSVYGDCQSAVEDSICDVRGLYPAVKLASEFFVQRHIQRASIRIVVPRIFNMFGGDDSFSIVSKISNAIMMDCELEVSNDGAAVRDFIFIDDVVAAYRSIINSNFSGILNIGTGKGVSVREVIDIGERVFGKKLRIKRKTQPEISVSVASVKRLQALLPAHQFYSIHDYYRYLAEGGRENESFVRN